MKQRWKRFLALLPVLAIVLSRSFAGAEDVLPATQTVFAEYSERVVKIEVVEKDSGAKAVVGSGFFVGDDGRIVTNYHVISNLVVHPERYRAELVGAEGARRPLAVLAVDVINDLAAVKVDASDVPHFSLASAEPAQGTRLYSLGFPLDIGLSIVEGTYNGLMKHALYRKIHFTAPINPGMSGGPAINARGEVVGVNVASAGEEVSFLVPTEAVVRLLASVPAGKARDAKAFLEDVRQQLLAHQGVYFSDSLMASGESVRLGNYRLPSRLAPFFNCWGDAEHRENLRYETYAHQCSTDDYIFISGTHRSGILRFSHRLIKTEDMNRFGFYALYSSQFEDEGGMYGNEEEVTRFGCESGTVRQGRLTFKTVFCARAFRKLEGLYDVVFKVAVLDSMSSGLETTLEISGVTFEKAVLMSQGYLGAITWAE